MLKVWNVSLIVGTFTLALLGTFLVRSGVLESIHAFGASTVGGWFLGLIAVVLAGSTALIVSRLDALRSERRIDSLASREAVFLLNNLLLVGLCFVDLLGHVLPAHLGGGDRDALERRPAVVRPLYGPARDRPRVAGGNRAAARMAARDRRAAATAVCRSGGGQCGDRCPAGGVHRRRDEPAVADAVRLRGVHDRRGGDSSMSAPCGPAG